MLAVVVELSTYPRMPMLAVPTTEVITLFCTELAKSIYPFTPILDILIWLRV